jgi:hypothetical protein
MSEDFGLRIADCGFANPNPQSAVRSPQSAQRLSIAFALFISLTSPFATGAELQWRKAGPKRFTPSANAEPVKADAKSKFAKPQPRRDGAVRTVGFEDDGRAVFDGPNLTAEQAGGGESRSMLVEGETAEGIRGVVRSAQLQFQSPADNRYHEQITQPFAPPTVEEETTEMDLDEEEITLPATESAETDTTTQPGMMERQPRSFQPAPPRDAPRPDPFVDGDEEPNAGLPPANDPTLSDEGAEAEAYCQQELADLKAQTLDQVDLSIAVSGRPGRDFPYECSIDDGNLYDGRCWDETTYMWKASAVCHKPLYFEDVALERYGHSWGPCLDPLVSGAHFFGRLPVLPYCMGLNPPNECMYALGYYRPGNCAPYLIPPVPISCRAAAVQAGVTTGTVFLIP